MTHAKSVPSDTFRFDDKPQFKPPQAPLAQAKPSQLIKPSPSPKPKTTARQKDATRLSFDYKARFAYKIARISISARSEHKTLVSKSKLTHEDKLFNFLSGRHALSAHRQWPEAWRKATPKNHYDFIIVGGGGHGLATAYYLAQRYKKKNIALIERGPIGLGNVGRNTTIVRANYMLDGNQSFYALSLRLWETLSQELNYNVMFSQRGVLSLCHSQAQRDTIIRRGNTTLAHGADANSSHPTPSDASHPASISITRASPSMADSSKRRAGTARHDAVAWGFARAASALGVDIIEHCELLDIETHHNEVIALETSRGRLKGERIGLACAGHSSHVAAMAGLSLPIESHVLQAFVSEPIKPFLDIVISFGVGHFYISQSDKGGLVFGGDIDRYNSYAQRGNMPLVEHVAQAGVSMIPSLARLRMLRSWGGIMDMSMDGSPIIDHTPIKNLYLNAGWCYGGFKATPASGLCFAHLLATDTHHDVAKAYRLDRFARGRLIDEAGRGAFPNLH